MKKQMAAVVAASLTLACNAAKSDSPAKPDYAVVDAFELMRTSDAGKKISQLVEAKEVQYRTELENEQKRLGTELQDLQAKKATLSPELIAKKETDIKRRQEDLGLRAQECQRELQAMMQQASQDLYKDMQDAAAKIGKDHGLKVVWNKTGEALWVADEVNVTDAVTKELNKKTTIAKAGDAKKETASA